MDQTAVTVVGAGLMGRGIAYVSAAIAGFETTLVDLDTDVLDAAVERIHLDVAAGVERGKLDAEVTDQIAERLHTTTDLAEGCRGADLVIEAVVERMDVKHEVLRAAEAVVARDALVATNTSSMSVTEIMASLDRPERGVGMHFFNPVPKMALCELIRALQTAPATLDRAEAYATAMGKQTVRVEDLPGFATSRINALIGNEAMRMLEEGVASAEDIDTACKLGFGHAMGPLATTDLTGVDILAHASSNIYGETGDSKFFPPELLSRMVDAGDLGRKTGRGFYTY